MSFLFDSNVLIRSLQETATAQARQLLRNPSPAISRITWMEVLAGAVHPEETREFLSHFLLIEITAEISGRTLAPRLELRLKLPDAIIYATALETNRTLVTYNGRDFRPTMPNVLIPE